MAFFSEPRQKLSRPLRLTQSIWARKSASSRFSTRGARIYFTILICIASFRVVGLSPDGAHWISCRPGFFLPVRVLSRLFRRLFLKYLEKAFDSGRLQFFGALEPLRDAHEFRSFMAPLYETEWVVYAKPPFAGPQQVLDYVGRYTHRVAISNNRLLDIEQDHVTFQWKDYRHHDRPKRMTLSGEEFIRRFLIHVLPGWIPAHPLLWLFSVIGSGEEKLALCRQLLGMPAVEPETAAGDQLTVDDYEALYEKLTGSSLGQCPVCRQGRMVVVEILAPCAPASDTS